MEPMKRILITLTGLALALSAQAQDLTFDSLTLGALDTQDGWTAPAQATIVADPTGGTTNFSGNVLSLTGGTGGAAMNSYAVNSFAGTPSVFSMDVWIAPGTGADPAELFTRFNSWSSYIAIKWADQTDPATGIIEVPGQNLSGLTIPFSTVFNLQAVYTVAGGTASEIAFAIDGSPIGSITGLSIDMAAGASIEMRSQKVQSYVDNVVVPEPSTYAALLGLLALGFVAWRRRR
jgi:hypothetical protein